MHMCINQWIRYCVKIKGVERVQETLFLYLSPSPLEKFASGKIFFGFNHTSHETWGLFGPVNIQTHKRIHRLYSSRIYIIISKNFVILYSEVKKKFSVLFKFVNIWCKNLFFKLWLFLFLLGLLVLNSGCDYWWYFVF